MWTRILLKPWWARTLAVAGVDAVLGAVDWCARWLGGDQLADDHYHNVYTLAVQVAAILIFGLVVAGCTGNSHLAYSTALAGLDPVQRSAAVDASFRGPVPVDARVRDAAIRVALRRLCVARFWRVMWLVLLGLWVPLVAVVLVRGETRSLNLHLEDGINFAVLLYLTVAAWHVSLSVKHRLQTLGQTQIQSPLGVATSSAPGCYPDPRDRNLMRYFDGRMWTPSIHPRGY